MGFTHCFPGAEEISLPASSSERPRKDGSESALVIAIDFDFLSFASTFGLSFVFISSFNIAEAAANNYLKEPRPREERDFEIVLDKNA